MLKINQYLTILRQILSGLIFWDHPVDVYLQRF